MANKRIYLCLAHMNGTKMGFIQEAFDTNGSYLLAPMLTVSKLTCRSFAAIIDRKEKTGIPEDHRAGSALWHALQDRHDYGYH